MQKLQWLLLMISLSSCVGSFEDGGSPVRLIVSVNPTSSGSIDCKGNALIIPQKPGLVLLDLSRFTGTSSNLECGKFLELTGAPFSTINDAISTPNIYVSLPSKGVVQRFNYQTPNTLLPQSPEFKPGDGSEFCPTQLVVTQETFPNTQRLAVLDNPSNDQNTGCVSSSNRKLRVLVFTIGAAITPPLTPTSNPKEFDISNFNFSSGGVSIAVFNNRLYVLGAEFNGRYRIVRFELSDPTIKISSDLFSLDAKSVSLSVIQNQNRILASFPNDTTGKVLPIVENNGVTPNTVAFGDELRAGTTATDPVIGKTTLIRSGGFSTSSFTLFLRSDNVLFQKASQFVSQNLSSPIDATFPLDNSIWLLSIKSLLKADTRFFPEKPQFDSGIDLTGLNPGNVVWTFDESQ